VIHSSVRKLVTLFALIAFASAGLGLLASQASAKKSKSTQNEAKWISFDEAGKTVTVKILKAGKGPNKKMLKKGKEATFNVIPTGSVLTRTSVAINGVKGEMTDIAEGKTVLIYWVPDPDKEGEFFARKIDVVMSEEEFAKRYDTEDQ